MNHLEYQLHRGNLLQCFHQGTRNWETNSRVLFANTLIRQIWVDLISCMNELQQQAYTQRLEVQDAQHGYIESRREKVRLQEELTMKEKALRDTQIRRMRGMGEMKRAQELRVVEISLHKLRENYETIQKLTSQLQGGIKLQWEIV